MISVGSVKTYTKALGLSLLVGFSSCDRCSNKVVENVVKTDTLATTKKVLSLLERGDRHSAKFIGVPDDVKILTAKDAKQLCENDSGEVFYRVYVGKADKAIRKAKKKKGDLVTVAQGITGLNCIKLAGGAKAYEGDYISARVADSLLTDAIHEKDSILRANIADTAYKKLKQNEKDAVLSYLYNVNECILKKAPKGKSFFQHLIEGNLGMVQSKFNICPSAKSAEAGLSKRNLINLIIFGNGKIYEDKAAQDNFVKQVKKISRHKNGESLLNEVIEISRKYGVDSLNLEQTKEKIFRIANKK